MELEKLQNLCRLLRYYILTMTTEAGSGHPTSSLSAVELTAVLFFNYFRFDLDHPENQNNDRLIFSKGHATPLFYSLYAAAGKITEQELLRYRKFDSNLQGHPMPDFPYTEVPTGSLGQGLSVGVGEALAIRKLFSSSESQTSREASFKNNDGSRLRSNENIPRVFVLLGDGEMSEGSVWEAIQYAGFQKLNNLVALLDVNRLGQSEATMLEYDIETYRKRVESFGWEVVLIKDGHNLEEINRAFSSPLSAVRQKPLMIIAKTVKGKGYREWEDKNGWHGKPLTKEELEKALVELGPVDKSVRGTVHKPHDLSLRSANRRRSNPIANEIASSSRLGGTPRNDVEIVFTQYQNEDKVATRKAYGTGLVRLGKLYSDIVSLDGDVKNSTYSELFKQEFPDRFFDLYIAEQNMVGVALGFARRDFVPFVSTFSAFMSRAADQIRMAALSGQHLVLSGSHAGVSIGEDGPSQMGLEDISFFRTVFESQILYPADATATERLLELAYWAKGIVYLRTTRPETPVLYGENESFEIGGSKVFDSIHNSPNSPSYLKRGLGGVTLVAAGIMVHEALKAQKTLAGENIAVQVIDCYSVKPIDAVTLQKAAAESAAIVTVEDHYIQGGLGDAVLEALAEVAHPPIFKLAVTKLPRSGKPDELLDFEGISAKAIVAKIKNILTTK